MPSACCLRAAFSLTRERMQGSASPRLSAKGLACRRGDRLLFRGLSLELRGGEALHITGANGTGKTTLIRVLSGLTSPYSGEIEREGMIGLLDERPALDPDLPLQKSLQFWERVDGCEDPASAIDSLGLTPLLDVPVRYLSTGQRKRAGFAALLNRRASIWLLDEPLSGLDSGAIDQVTTLIREFIQGGGLTIIASHQPLDILGMQTLAIEGFAPSLDESV